MPTTRKAIIRGEAQPLAWYVWRENGRRKSEKPAEMRSKPMTVVLLLVEVLLA